MSFDRAGPALLLALPWAAAAEALPCTDCAYLTTASLRLFRGGDFVNAASALLPPFRDYGNPGTRDGGRFPLRTSAIDTTDTAPSMKRV